MKGIIMGAESVRAILAGRKTMTRRVIKPQPDCTRVELFGETWLPVWNESGDPSKALAEIDPIRCPYRPGETVYVRETWRGFQNEFGSLVQYKASDPDPTGCDYKLGRYQSPLFMPEWAARLHLTITDVRVERLQEIEPDDVLAEGLDLRMDSWGRYYDNSGRWEPNADIFFRDTWNETGGKRPGCSWEDDPYVFVYTFEVQP